MTEGEKRPREASRKHRRLYGGGAFFIVITVVIIALFTGGIAYGVQGLVAGGPVEEGEFVDGAVQFRIVARQWSFEPAIIKVNPGDRVRFILTSMDISHGFSINELGINLALNPEKDTIRTVVIPPDIADGVYAMYCSVFCGIGHPYMKGKIIIGDPELFLGVGLGRILPYMATAVMAVMFAAIIVIGRRRAR